MQRLMLVLGILLYAQNAVAEITAGHSVEWLAHKSEVIAEATPIAVTSFLKDDGPVRYFQARYRIDLLIKGAVTKGDVITIYHFSRSTIDPLELRKAQQKKKTLLIFVNVARNQFKRINGKYTYTHTHSFKSAFHKGQNTLPTKLYTPDSNLVSSGYKEILIRARAQVEFERDFKQRNSENKVEGGSVNVPLSSVAHTHLYGGSSSFIYVPIYKEKLIDKATLSPKLIITRHPKVEPGYRIIQPPQPDVLPRVQVPEEVKLKRILRK